MAISFTKMTELKKILQDWWNSDSFKEMQKMHEEDLQRAVGKYHMLSENDKIDMVNAICHIMCQAERRGTSHRGLMNELGIYPAGFWIDDLMTVHNALWMEFQSEEVENYKAETLSKDVDLLQSLDSNVKLGSPNTEVSHDSNE